MIDSIISKTIEYLGVPAVVGHEQFFMDLLEEDFKKLGLTIFRHQNYIAVSGEAPMSSILCAHIDRHGLISIGDSEYVYAAQYMKEIKYGKNNRLVQQQLEGIAKRFEGEKIFAYDDDTGEILGKGLIEVCDPCILNGDALFFVNGMDAMEPNVPLAYARTARFENGYLKGQIDNAISLGVIYNLFKHGFQGTALLTTEEEIGQSWRHIKEHLELTQTKTQHLIIIDTSPYTDNGVIEEGPVVLRSRDMNAEFNTSLVTQLIERAQTLNIPYQVKDQILTASGKAINQLGSTELGKLIEKTEGQWNGATVQIPTLMYHTSNETTTKQAIENYFLFLIDILINNPIQDLAAESMEG